MEDVDSGLRLPAHDLTVIKECKTSWTGPLNRT